MSNDEQIYRTAMAGYQSALADEEAAYRKAQLSGDMEEAVRAGQSMAALRVQATEFHNMATQHAASMRPAAPPNEFGLSAAESEVAKFSGITEKEYAANKAKLHRMRAAGEYPERERN